ncbi:hypothetical protein YDYSY3_38250 [Paenibacillus chitinolyticus]|uniref:hypothetical protein n=1 Tax=Paenibacillus chitinolyticus TaxID=79263 RepID=UPI0026E4F99B|nr:hypothetical protein [Paenibacillus chitinolyticus]GKS12825.1 hypothetical protein YDYSY3_38250 [Paenibacillus chitinolyticus]
MDDLKRELQRLIDVANLEKEMAAQSGQVLARMEWQGRTIGLYDALEAIERFNRDSPLT